MLTKKLTSFKQFLRENSRYVVLFSSSLSFMCSPGFSYGVVGPLTVAQSERFNETITDSSWTGSVHIGTFLIMGPFAAMLTKVLSDRFVQVVGGVLAAICITLSSLSQRGWQVTVCFGFFTGTALSLVRCASSDILVYHFDEHSVKYALSTVMVGCAVGLASFPTISELVFERFHFSGGMAILALSMKVWCFVISGLLRKFGVTAFFSIVDAYVIAKLNLSASQGALGSTIMGTTSILAVCLTCLIQKFDYSRLLLHGVGCIFFGVTVNLLTLAQNQASHSTIMALIGLIYGVQIGNLLSVAYELSGKESMVLTMGMELMLEGVGSIGGPPITSYIQQNYGLNGGLFLSGCSCIAAGMVIVPIFIRKRAKHVCYQNTAAGHEFQQLILTPQASEPIPVTYQTVLPQGYESDDEYCSSAELKIH